MKNILSIFFISFCFPAFSQSFSENDLRQMAEQFNNEFKGMDMGNGVIIRGCIANNKTLIYQYNVDENWDPSQTIKDDLISNLKESGIAGFYYNNGINVEYQYYTNNTLRKRIIVNSQEFFPRNLELGEYISIESHLKAKGVNLKLRQPLGWRIEEGDRPNIVKKFVYESNMYLILVLENATFFSRNEARELLSDSDYLSNLISEATSTLGNVEIINQSTVTVDRYPALVYTIEGEMERIGINMRMIFKTWIVLYEDKIVYLQSGGVSKNEFYSYEPLFDLITNSVVFPEQYIY